MIYRLGMVRVAAFIKSEGFKPTFVLLMAVLLPAVHKYFTWFRESGSNYFFGMDSEVVIMFAVMFILMGIMPAFTIRYLFGENLKDFGVKVGDWKSGLLLVAVILPLITVLLLYPGSLNPEMQLFFPYDKSAGRSIQAFMRYELVRGLLFYTAWEFFFRGFVLFGLRDRVGDSIANLIQTIPSCLWHIGGPGGELFSSIPGGFLFGVIALRTRSILWPLLLHYLIGVINDLLIVVNK